MTHYKFTYNVWFSASNERCVISVSAPDKKVAADKVRGIIEDTLDYMFNLIAVEEIKH